MRIMIALIILITLAGCSGNVARAHVPVGHTELTIEEYNDAEAHFAGVSAPPPPPPGWKGGMTDRECQELLDKRDGVSYVLMGLGVLTGGSGLTSVIPKDMEKEKKENFEIAFGSLTLAFGVTDAVLVGVLKTLSARYEKNCVTESDPEDRPPVPTVPGASDGDAGELDSLTDAGVDGP